MVETRLRLLIVLLCAVGVAGVAAVLLSYPAVASEPGGESLVARDDKDEDNAEAIEKSQNNLKQIGLAMHNYADANGRLPPAATHDADGKALLSWRVLILPYIEEGDLYNQFKLDEPWDSENNKKLLEKIPKIYAPVGDVKTKKEHATFYQVFSGKGAAFDGKEGLRFPADFPDGTSNTILSVEAGEAVPWSKPDDLTYDPDKKLPKLGGLFKTGFNVGVCDGSVRFVKKGFNEKTFRLLITRNDGEVASFDDLDK
jgi:hypothetical protein